MYIFSKNTSFPSELELSMKMVDTTDPQAHQDARSLFEDDAPRRSLAVVDRFRIHLGGMYHAQVGPEWGSDGRRQCDFLHHIEIPFAGSRWVDHGDRALELEPGHAYFLPGNTPVGRRCEEPGEVLYLTFRCEWLPGVDPLLDWVERAPVCIGPSDKSDWLAWLQSERDAEDNHMLLVHGQIQTWLATILPPLFTIIEQHLRTHAQFEPVFKLVEESLGADLRITDMARAYGTAAHAFSMAFSASTGFTPKAYLNRRLNQAAAELVIGTELTVKEIAHQLRFSDAFYFSRFFKKQNGIAPSGYRRRFRGR